MKIEIELIPPIMPTYIGVTKLQEYKQDDDHPAQVRVHVSQLSKQDAEEYGELMKQEFIKHHEKMTTKLRNGKS